MNKPRELYSILDALAPGARLRLRAFGERYCAGGSYFDKYAGASNLQVRGWGTLNLGRGGGVRRGGQLL